MDGVLNKMIITPFGNKRMSGGGGPAFTVPINPENYSRTLSIQYDRSQGQGTQQNNQKYKRTKPEEIKFDFTFDNTGTVQGNLLDGTPVTTQIADFLETVYYLDGKIHAPSYVKIFWGDLKFGCRLKSLSIKYTLFNPSGEPLRAQLSATFRGYVESERRVREENKSSPDLTHVKRVQEGENLPFLVYEIYDDTRYFLQVAKANGLTSPRKLSVGKSLMFPPVKKDEA